MRTPEIIQSKILSSEAIEPLLTSLRFKKKRVVFTNGCFDILHRGHIDYLARSADLGDFLIVGLNTDQSVKTLKGEGRPVQDENSRALILASLLFVDAVILFDDETPIDLIKKIGPDILVKGGDYKPEDIVGYDIVTSGGGEVLALPLVAGYSTTGIVNKLH